jgi:general secretion pathway protein A
MLSSNKKIVIILDEAQKISATVLDSLKDLTNIVHNNSSVITIILVGQPELTSKLKKLPQIDQRISLKYHLNYLSLDDTKEYIRFRQFASGSQKDLFTEEAMRMIHSQTHGIPREINRACRIALDYGYSEELEIITDKEMKMILRDFA